MRVSKCAMEVRFVLEAYSVELTVQDLFDQVNEASLILIGELLRVLVQIFPGRPNRYTMDLRLMYGD